MNARARGGARDRHPLPDRGQHGRGGGRRPRRAAPPWSPATPSTPRRGWSRRHRRARSCWASSRTRLVRDAVDAEPVDPIAAKGKAEPVEAYRLVAVRAGAEGRARHLDAPMVGRDRELATLTDAWRKAVDERTPHLVTLVAPAGVGKSRLVREFIERVRARRRPGPRRPLPELRRGHHLLAGPRARPPGRRASPRRTTRPAASSASASCSRASETRRCSPPRSPPSSACRPTPRRRRSCSGPSAASSSTSPSSQPTLVVLEDLHWAEDTLLDLVDYIVDLAAGVPLLLLGHRATRAPRPPPGASSRRERPRPVIRARAARAPTPRAPCSMPSRVAPPSRRAPGPDPGRRRGQPALRRGVRRAAA